MCIRDSSCTGVHGANRLASNSLLEGLVFAHRIAEDIVERFEHGELPAVTPGPAAPQPPHDADPVEGPFSPALADTVLLLSLIHI